MTHKIKTTRVTTRDSPRALSRVAAGLSPTPSCVVVSCPPVRSSPPRDSGRGGPRTSRVAAARHVFGRVAFLEHRCFTGRSDRRCLVTLLAVYGSNIAFLRTWNWKKRHTHRNRDPRKKGKSKGETAILLKPHQAPCITPSDMGQSWDVTRRQGAWPAQHPTAKCGITTACPCTARCMRGR